MPPMREYTRIAASHYDRSPLTPSEYEAMAVAIQVGLGANQHQYRSEALKRFERPIYAVMGLRTKNVDYHRGIRRLLYGEMVRRKTALWQWSKDVWKQIICPTPQDYRATFGINFGRSSLMDMAYLLSSITNLQELGQKQGALATAQSIFGRQVVDQEVTKVMEVVFGQQGQGYTATSWGIDTLTQALGLLFLLNRSPYLSDLSTEVLDLAGHKPHGLLPRQIKKITRALHQLHLLAPPETKSAAPLFREGNTEGIAPLWVAWCNAWLQRYPKPSGCLRGYYNLLLRVGRWLADRHPDIISPQQWDEELAQEYLHYLCSTATAGDYTSKEGMAILITKGKAGKPLAPRAIESYLCALTCFFSDVQKKPHQIGDGRARTLKMRFNPQEVFRLPSSLKKLIQPDPRDIDEVLWCKLTYAAATLQEEHLHSLFPVSYYRAAALLWVTSARRPNEIARLQVGCVRREWDPAMLDEEGLPVPGQEAQLCYLRVPTNKTRGPFWVPIPKYTADAVEAWERERPTHQPKLVDSKDYTLVDFLFCLRGRKMGEGFINACYPKRMEMYGVHYHSLSCCTTGK